MKAFWGGPLAQLLTTSCWRGMGAPLVTSLTLHPHRVTLHTVLTRQPQGVPRHRQIQRPVLGHTPSVVPTQPEPEARILGTEAGGAQCTLEPSYHLSENQPLPCHSQKVWPFCWRLAGHLCGHLTKGRSPAPLCTREGTEAAQCHPRALGLYLALKRHPSPVTTKIEYIFKYRKTTEA